MSTTAIVMLVLAAALVWGGLVASAIHLLRNPDETSGTLADAAEFDHTL
ncbi:methionine/alanine import family NSS transporter small subunit [Micrococcus sp.]|nr:methionine/alanine import family NSS transporter small subunit [Micrococcus sp.]MDY6055292.1 methionine/alanine import family NSS transporter small subunit [Micrococcus sp.]